jgi:alpha-L-rhamnosidase
MGNKLQEITRRSLLANFCHFPTDCPQREKNGWAADAALASEATLLNFDPETNYREWMRNICKAQREDGALPGIIPTTGWGFHWGNGPAWDCVQVWLPYYTYLYRGDRAILQQAAAPLQRYLTYLQGKRDERGLLAIGLGDWCQPRRSREGDYTTPLVVTDTIVAADIAAKAAQIYKVLGMTQQTEFAAGMYEDLRNCVRKHLIDRETGTVYGATQTGQAIALAYGMFEEDEKEKAVNRLLALIGEKDGFMDTGVIGARVIFRVLADHGYADLAYHMITRPEYPSYGNWMMRGATTLWEGFWEENAIRYLSMNHHFWGDVSAWFYMYLAGIRIQPGEVTVKPCFVKKLNWVKASYQLPEGKITVQWERTEDGIALEVTAPETVRISIDAPGARIKRIGY